MSPFDKQIRESVISQVIDRIGDVESFPRRLKEEITAAIAIFEKSNNEDYADFEFLEAILGISKNHRDDPNTLCVLRTVKEL